jgi:SH3-like domain-containing protein
MTTPHSRIATSAIPAILAILAIAGLLAPLAVAQEKPAVPRFVSLRAEEVNLRAGPGKQYPVEWVFLRRALPVEIVADYGHWRKIRDLDGSEGWVHKSLLSGQRWAMVTGDVRTLRRTAGVDAAPVLRAEAGVLGRLLACEGEWCRLEIEGSKGWLPRRELWGVYPEETIE